MLKEGRREVLPMKRLLAAAALFGLAACETIYPESHGPRLGYTEEMISSNRYKVSYTAPAETRQQDIANRVLARAAQLTLDKGNDWFEIAGRINGDHTQTLIIVMGSGETLAGGSAKTYNAKETLSGLKSKIS